MAYSRWDKSTWYTFWADTATEYKLPTNKLKRAQTFEICDFPIFRFTYGELEDNGIRGILSKIKRFYSTPHKGKIFKKFSNGKATYEDTVYEAKRPNAEQLRELLNYISEWQKDVDYHFKFWVFVKYEWWHPIRRSVLYFINKIKFGI